MEGPKVPALTRDSLQGLVGTVQHNCNVSDARHGADFPLCTYLMKMREYFRWEKGLPFGAPLPREEIGEWLQAREELWETLEEAPFRPLKLDRVDFDPFAAEAINQVLRPRGLVYSAGLGNLGKPHFFLGNLESHSRVGAFEVAVSALEHARDLTAPPAMTLGDRIFLRRESLRRMLWERLEGWRWSRPDNALGRAFSCYDFENDLDAALEAMAEVELDTLRLHEVGEHRAGVLLGRAWEEMLLHLLHTPAERMVRAVRDHLADCLTTLPELIEGDNPAPLHFYLGNLTPLRKELFPGLEAAYQRWLQGDRGRALRALAARGGVHWLGLAERALATYRQEPRAAAERIRALVEGARL